MAEATVVDVVVVAVGTVTGTESVVTEDEVGGEATTAVRGRWLTSEPAVETAQKATAVVAEVASNQSRTSPERFIATMLAEMGLLLINRG